MLLLLLLGGDELVLSLSLALEEDSFSLCEDKLLARSGSGDALRFLHPSSSSLVSIVKRVYLLDVASGALPREQRKNSTSLGSPVSCLPR